MNKPSGLDREELWRQAEERDLKNKQEVEDLKAMLLDYLDDDGYPTDHALLIIEKWHWSDPTGWFKFIEGIWWMPSFGWRENVGGIDKWTEQELEDTTVRYHISTLGWSGNESIIGSMKTNIILWGDTWVQSRRGGHYIFEVKQSEMDE